MTVTKGEQVLPVDTHVHRVLNRLWIVDTKTPLQTDKQAEKVFKKENLSKLHHTLILFGRYKCKAIKPECQTCELKAICKFYNKKLK